MSSMSRCIPNGESDGEDGQILMFVVVGFLLAASRDAADGATKMRDKRFWQICAEPIALNDGCCSGSYLSKCKPNEWVLQLPGLLIVDEVEDEMRKTS